MSGGKRKPTVFDLELEILKRVYSDPRFPDRGSVTAAERTLRFDELVVVHGKKVVDEWNRGELEL